MNPESPTDTIKFSVGPLKGAATELNPVHLSGINISGLARDRLTQMFLQSMTDDDNIAMEEYYPVGDLSEGAAQALFADELNHLKEDIDAFRKATEDDTNDYLV